MFERGRNASNPVLPFALDLGRRVMRLEVPAYFFHRAYDYDSARSYALAKAYVAATLGITTATGPRASRGLRPCVDLLPSLQEQHVPEHDRTDEEDAGTAEEGGDEDPDPIRSSSHTLLSRRSVTLAVPPTSGSSARRS